MRERILSRIRALCRERGSVFVGIDGRCAAGKTTLADELAQELDCPVVHMDDFYLPFAQRTSERMAQPAGHMDLERFEREILASRGGGRQITYRPFDCSAQILRDTVSIPSSPVLIIEGSYSCHPSLRDYYDLTVFLGIAPDEQRRRILARNGAEALTRFECSWIPAEEAYFTYYQIERHCEVVFGKDSIMEKAKVYFTKEITPESLVRIYDAMDRDLCGKVAVKISTGEPGGHNFLQPELIAALVQKLNGTVVECNTAYEGRRNTTEAHLQTFRDHGFTAIAPCDLMDQDGQMALPVRGGFHLAVNYVGDHLARYDSMLVLSHFKGHVMGGFGGALKNLSIGVASAYGKGHIHCNGAPFTRMEDMFSADHDSFLESMADADSAVMDYMGRKNLLYINVANRLSVDCDCSDHPKDPEMADLGIFASTDPVALDQACVDAVYSSDDPGKVSLIERMESRNGIHTVEAASTLRLGSREYELVCID